jgi:hypothetical protein
VEVGFECQVYGGFAAAMHNTEWTATPTRMLDAEGNFEIMVTGLRPGVEYQYRAFVKHPKIVMRGDHKLFTAGRTRVIGRPRRFWMKTSRSPCANERGLAVQSRPSETAFTKWGEIWNQTIALRAAARSRAPAALAAMSAGLGQAKTGQAIRFAGPALLN